MTLFFLVALGSAWFAVLLPAARRARRNAPLSSAQQFKRGLQSIAPPRAGSSGRWIVTPTASSRIGSSERRVLERRKRIFELLTLVAAATFLWAMVEGDTVWQVNLAVDTILFSYSVVLVGLKRRRLENSIKIRPLPTHREHMTERFSFNEPIQASGGGG